MDFWAQRCLEEIKEAEEQQVQPHKHTTDRAMADTVMDFLFASQDATTAAVVWVTVLMAEYPDVLQKVGTLLSVSVVDAMLCYAMLLSINAVGQRFVYWVNRMYAYPVHATAFMEE